MKIELTEEEYETLLETALVGNFVVNAFKTDETYSKKHEDLMQYLLDQADALGLEKHIVKSPEGILPTEKLTNNMHEHLEAFLEVVMEDTLSEMDNEDFDLEGLVDFDVEEQIEAITKK